MSLAEAILRAAKCQMGLHTWTVSQNGRRYCIGCGKR